MLRAVIRENAGSGVTAELHGVEGLPLYVPVTRQFEDADAAKKNMEHLHFKWDRPDELADPDVLFVGR